MLASGDKVSQTSYHNEKDEYVDTGIRNGIIFPEWIKEFKMNLSTFMFEVNYLVENLNKVNDNLSDIDDNYLYLYIINKEDRVLGIRESLTTTRRKYNNEIMIKHLISTVCNIYNSNEISNQLDDLLDLYCGNRSRSSHQIHLDELNRYKYMLSKEFKLFNKFKNKSKYYLLDNNKITNTKLSRVFKIIRRIIKK